MAPKQAKKHQSSSSSRQATSGTPPSASSNRASTISTQPSPSAPSTAETEPAEAVEEDLGLIMPTVDVPGSLRLDPRHSSANEGFYTPPTGSLHSSVGSSQAMESGSEQLIPIRSGPAGAIRVTLLKSGDVKKLFGPAAAGLRTDMVNSQTLESASDLAVASRRPSPDEEESSGDAEMQSKARPVGGVEADAAKYRLSETSKRKAKDEWKRNSWLEADSPPREEGAGLTSPIKTLRRQPKIEALPRTLTDPAERGLGFTGNLKRQAKSESLSQAHGALFRDNEEAVESGSSPLIARKDSMAGLSSRLKGPYFTLTGELAVDSPQDATVGRVEMLRDWIEHHSFEESSREAMALVDWDQVLSHERVLAYAFAVRRAKMAEHEFTMLAEGAIRPPRVEYPVTLSTFADGDADDGDILSLTEMPKLDLPGLGECEQLPRTIVVLAKIYHTIAALNEKMALENAQWQLFLAWVARGPQKDADVWERRLDEMCLPSLVLKGGACYISNAVQEARQEYGELAARAQTVRQHLIYDKHSDLGKVLHASTDIPLPSLPQGCVDICALEVSDIRALDVSGYEAERDFKKSIILRAKALGHVHDTVEKLKAALREIQRKEKYLSRYY